MGLSENKIFHTPMVSPVMVVLAIVGIQYFRTNPNHHQIQLHLDVMFPSIFRQGVADSSQRGILLLCGFLRRRQRQRRRRECHRWMEEVTRQGNQQKWQWEIP